MVDEGKERERETVTVGEVSKFTTACCGFCENLDLSRSNLQLQMLSVIVETPAEPLYLVLDLEGKRSLTVDALLLDFAEQDLKA